jgi:hypothetical protein
MSSNDIDMEKVRKLLLRLNDELPHSDSVLLWQLANKVGNQRIEINNLLGSAEKAVSVITELKGKPCDAVIHHGPGHQSTTGCHLRHEHVTHEANLAGQIAEWEDEEEG